MALGYNPITWDCSNQGCFNKKCRPKIECFHDLFPGKISFGDIDAIVEINGYGLVLEWKYLTPTLPIGQHIMWERLTRTGLITVLVVEGDPQPEPPTVHRIGCFYKGSWKDMEDGDYEKLRRWISAWVEKAQGNGFR